MRGASFSFRLQRDESLRCSARLLPTRRQRACVASWPDRESIRARDAAPAPASGPKIKVALVRVHLQRKEVPNQSLYNLMTTCLSRLSLGGALGPLGPLGALGLCDEKSEGFSRDLR